MSNWSPTYKAVCDICGETQEVSNYGDWACRKCLQGYTYEECHQIALTDAQLALLRNPPKWIGVDERLPELGEPVLACWSRQKVGMGTAVMREWCGKVAWRKVDQVEELDEPIAWMPLPEPPNCTTQPREGVQ